MANNGFLPTNSGVDSISMSKLYLKSRSPFSVLLYIRRNLLIFILSIFLLVLVICKNTANRNNNKIVTLDNTLHDVTSLNETFSIFNTAKQLGI